MYHEVATATLPPIDYVQQTDVLCGRGKAFTNHKGNINFISMIKSNVQGYIDAPTRLKKSMVIIEMAENLCLDSGLRFLKKDKISDQWIQLGFIQAKDKIGHCIRDIIRKKGNSKNKTNRNHKSYVTIKKPSSELLVSTVKSDVEEDRRNDRMIIPPLPAFVQYVTDEHSFDVTTKASTSEYITDSDDELIFSASAYDRNNCSNDIVMNETLRRSSLCLTYKDLTNEESMANFQF